MWLVRRSLARLRLKQCGSRIYDLNFRPEFSGFERKAQAQAPAGLFEPLGAAAAVRYF
jgi:hypothetical protein